MRILFVNHTFPGDLGPLLAAFAAQPEHEILFASCRGRRDFSVPGVRHVVLSPSRSRRLVGDGAGTSLDRAVEMGRQALQAFRLLRQNGFVPDMVLLSSALEQGLFLRDAFPEAFVACFAESLPSDGLAGDGKGLVRHLLQCRQMQQSDLAIRLAAEGATRDPEQRGAVTLPYPVDTDYFSPLALKGAASPNAGARVLCAVRDAADVCVSSSFIGLKYCMTEPSASPRLCPDAFLADAAADAPDSPRITTIASPSAYLGASSADAAGTSCASASAMTARRIFSFMCCASK